MIDLDALEAELDGTHAGPTDLLYFRRVIPALIRRIRLLLDLRECFLHNRRGHSNARLDFLVRRGWEPQNLTGDAWKHPIHRPQREVNPAAAVLIEMDNLLKDTA